MKNLCQVICSLFAMVLLFTSCEKDIEFDKQFESGIAVYALANTKEPFTMYVSRSFSVNTNPSIVYSDYSNYYDEIDSLYKNNAVIKDAHAEILVNNVDKYELRYNEKRPYNYVCDYQPKPGDNIAISVKAQGYKDVSAATKVEVPQEIEILKTEVVYKDYEDIDVGRLSDDVFDRYGVDSVMRITVRFSDPAGERNFYRLRVCAIADREEKMFGSYVHKYNLVTDVFSSDDIIFNDSQLTKPFGDWKAGFSNVFDDHLFNGEQHTFTVETRKRNGDNSRVVLELQSISQDLYYFLKSYMLFRISSDDKYMNPIGIHGNISSGWGILGSLSSIQHVLYY